MLKCEVEDCHVKSLPDTYEVEHQFMMRHLLTHIAEALNGLWGLAMTAPAPVVVSRSQERAEATVVPPVPMPAPPFAGTLSETAPEPIPTVESVPHSGVRILRTIERIPS